MKWSIPPTNGTSSCGKRRGQTAFTFAEVLAALVFMAVVIPVAMEGIQIANRAGVVAERKAVAARLADGLLHELTLSNSWLSAGQSGIFPAPWQNYRWQLRHENWSQDAMRLLTVEVLFQAQNRQYGVRLSTLMKEDMP